MKLQESRTGFYYVGTKRATITKLVNIYKRGYASGNLTETFAELRKDRLPDVVICDGGYGMKAIQQLAAFISKTERLSNIPFIIDSSDESLHDALIRNRIADDILDVKEWNEETFNAKIQFLQKFKEQSKHINPAYSEDRMVHLPGSFHAILKRSFDIMISLTALILLSPLLLLIAVAIRLESKGTIFYVAKRAGMGYRIFNFYKFRSMEVNADQRRTELAHLNQYQGDSALFFKLKDDPRITRVGKFLRNSSLDELPQLFNVLLGDMSLVGNRPLPLYEAENLTTNALAQRFLAPAGITGLWQIKKRGGLEMSEHERIGLDIDYANKSNLLYDMWIMANTPQALMQKANT